MLALRFLTVFPFGRDEDVTAEDLAGSTAYYPIVGGMLGLILYWFWQFSRTTWPVFLASALTVTLWVLLTAGLHLDGLMDTFDGLGIRGDRLRRLEVMRDSRVGAFGAQAAIFMVFLKIAAVAALSADARHFPALLLAPVAGRAAMVAFMSTSRYAREGEGLGRVFADRTGTGHLLASILFFLLLGFPAVGLSIIWVMLAQATVFLVVRTFLLHNFGGVTGDILGAVCELHELSLLLLAPLVL